MKIQIQQSRMARLILGYICVLGGLGIFPLQSSAQDSTNPQRRLPIELQPYEVTISISFGRNPVFSPRFRNEVVERVGVITQRLVGQMWNLTLADNRWLLPDGETGLQRLSANHVQQRYDDAKLDKVYLITLEVVGATFRVAACEWDQSSASLSPIAKRHVLQRRSLATEIVSLIEELFQPNIAIDQTNQQSVRARIKAGEYTPADSQTQLNGFKVKPGDILQPYFRYLDKDRVVRRVQKLPWTYLIVERVVRADAICQVSTGLRSPLSGKSRRRVEVLALGIRPQTKSTQLRLMTHSGEVLIGNQLTTTTQRPTRQPTEKPLLEKSSHYLSDRRGMVLIPVDNAHRILWLEIRSGKSLLAQVPFVPGVEPRSSIALPDDALRLRVEGQLEILQGELINTVARRSMYLSLAHKLAKASQWQRVDQVIKQLEELPVYRNYETQLTQIRFPALQTAARRKDRLAESKIKRMCRQTLEGIQRHLDDTKIKDLKTEMNELRSLDAEDKSTSSQ